MRKKLISLIIATIAVLSLAITAFAAPPDTPLFGRGFGGGFGCYWLATDDDGNLVSRDVFKANLDKLVKDGTIHADDKEFILEMFDYRTANGGPAFGRGYGRFGAPVFGRGFAVPNN